MENNSKHAEVSKSIWLKSAFISKKIDNSLATIHGLGLTEYMVLQNLMSAPNKSHRRIDLAESVGRTASGITRMLLPMEKIGLVKKEASPRDARASLVKITAAGEEIFNDASITLNQKSEQLLNNFSEKQIGVLQDLLDSIHGG